VRAIAPVDRFLAVIGALPIGLERLVQAAFGWERRPDRLVPRVALLLALLAVIPFAGWAIELIVNPISISDFVDRRVGPSTTLVEMDGYALLVAFPAEPPGDATFQPTDTAYRWYVVRDGLQELRVAAVRSPLALEALRRRSIVARVLDEPDAVSGAVAAIAQSGRATPDHVAPRLLAEVEQPRGDIRDIASLADLAGVSSDSLVRITLRMSGTGVATCAVAGTCDARRLADGIGSWDSLASEVGGDGWAIVRTSYPPSEARFHGVGRQVEDFALISRFLTPGWVQGLIGWAQVLHSAHVEQDISLPVDRLWLGPILFAATGGLLLFGRRLGYPRFRVTPASRPEGVTGSFEVHARVTGRFTPPGASPFEVRDAPAVLSRPDGTSALSIEIAGYAPAIGIPLARGSMGSLVIGELMEVRSTRPALRIGWFGSQAQLAFPDAASRDLVTSALMSPPRT